MKFQIPIVDELSVQENKLSLLNEHHLTGLFYNHFSDSTQREQCLTQYKKQWIHNQVIMEELKTIGELAKNKETHTTLLKGCHLLLDIYPDMGSRFLSDIDLLISDKNHRPWESILTELGYTAIGEKTFYANNFKREWCKIIGEVEINIELHTRLFFHLEVENWQFAETPFQNITKLQSEDLFIHLCGHLASQHTFLKLYWLFDIYFYYLKHTDQIDWSALKIKSIDHRLFRSVQMCLWTLGQHFGIELDNKIIDLFGIDKKACWKKLLTIDFLMYPHTKRYHYFLLKHATKDRLTSALRYDLAWFFHYKIRTPRLK